MVALIICIIIKVRNLRRWEQILNPCNSCLKQFCWWLELFYCEANGCYCKGAWRRSRWRSSAARCWPIDWIVSQLSWRYSWCTWRWQPLSWAQFRGEHLRLTITTLREVLSLPQWPITSISLPCTGGWLRTIQCHVEWRRVRNLRSATIWVLWMSVTIPMRRMILIGVSSGSTLNTSGSSWTII